MTCCWVQPVFRSEGRMQQWLLWSYLSCCRIIILMQSLLFSVPVNHNSMVFLLFSTLFIQPAEPQPIPIHLLSFFSPLPPSISLSLSVSDVAFPTLTTCNSLARLTKSVYPTLFMGRFADVTEEQIGLKNVCDKCKHLHLSFLLFHTDRHKHTHTHSQRNTYIEFSQLSTKQTV